MSFVHLPSGIILTILWQDELPYAVVAEIDQKIVQPYQLGLKMRVMCEQLGIASLQHANPRQLQYLKQIFVIGKSAPKCLILTAADTARALRGYGRDDLAKELEEAVAVLPMQTDDWFSDVKLMERGYGDGLGDDALAGADGDHANLPTDMDTDLRPLSCGGTATGGAAAGCPGGGHCGEGDAPGARGPIDEADGTDWRAVVAGDATDDAVAGPPDEGAAEAAAADPLANSAAGRQFAYANHFTEEHGKSLYCVAFNTIDPKLSHLFATAGSNRITVYECRSKGLIEPLQCYIDEDVTELFYACTWSFDPHTAAPLVAAAGGTGVIKIIDLSLGRVVRNLSGHGNSVNDLVIHPLDPNLVLSASKDCSARLWNMGMERCVVIFAGDGGHSGEVLSADISLDGQRVATCSMDHSVKIWLLDSAAYRHVVLSYQLAGPGQKPYEAMKVHAPSFSTLRVHLNYVDCVRWVGDTVLSKSLEDRIVRWMPRPKSSAEHKSGLRGGRVDILAEFHYRDAAVWYLRFGLDAQQRVVAVGTTKGAVYLFDVDRRSTRHVQVLTHPKTYAHVRSVSFSADGSVLLAACDGGTVYRYDGKKRE